MFQTHSMQKCFQCDVKTFRQTMMQRYSMVLLCFIDNETKSQTDKNKQNKITIHAHSNESFNDICNIGASCRSNFNKEVMKDPSKPTTPRNVETYQAVLDGVVFEDISSNGSSLKYVSMNITPLDRLTV